MWRTPVPAACAVPAGVTRQHCRCGLGPTCSQGTAHWKWWILLLCVSQLSCKSQSQTWVNHQQALNGFVHVYAMSKFSYSSVSRILAFPRRSWIVKVTVPSVSPLTAPFIFAASVLVIVQLTHVATSCHLGRVWLSPPFNPSLLYDLWLENLC